MDMNTVKPIYQGMGLQGKIPEKPAETAGKGNAFSEVLNKKLESSETESAQIKKDLKKKNEALLKACQQLETIFIKELLKSSEVKFNKGGFLAPSQEEKTFRDMLNDEYAQKISESKGMGIADMLYKQLKHKV